MSGETSSRTRPRSADNQSHRRGLAKTATVIVVATALVLTIGAGVTALHWRADAQASATPLPAPTVAVTPIAMQSGYETERRYLGRIEPARTTRLAFERSGLVTAVAVDEGSRVMAGQVLARLDTDLLEMERRRLGAARAEASARLAFAQQTLERRTSLAGRAVSQQRFDEVRFEAEALEAQVEAIDARIAAIEIDIKKSVLTAPFAGTVSERSLDDGAVVAAGAEIVRLLETGRLQARIGLPPKVSATLKLGDTYALEVLGKAVTGRLAALRPDLETGTRTLVALFDVADADFAAAGELAQMTLSRHVPSAGAWVPISALHESDNGLWSLFVVIETTDGPVIAREAVEVIHTADQRAYVRGTFGADAQIVTGGTNRLTPGQRVDIVRS